MQVMESEPAGGKRVLHKGIVEPISLQSLVHDTCGPIEQELHGLGFLPDRIVRVFSLACLFHKRSFVLQDEAPRAPLKACIMLTVTVLPKVWHCL